MRPETELLLSMFKDRNLRLFRRTKEYSSHYNTRLRMHMQMRHDVAQRLRGGRRVEQ